jgi:hypothetical protein
MSVSCVAIGPGDASTKFYTLFGSMNGNCSNSLGVYSAAANWTLLNASSPPAPRTGASVLILSSTTIVAFGGSCGGTYFNDVHRLDTTQTNLTWVMDTATGVPPSPRASPVAFIQQQQNMLYVFGGQTAAGAASDAYTYDLNAKVWAPITGLSQAPPARAAAASVGLQNRALMVGGTANGLAYDDTWQFVVQNQCLTLSCETCTQTTGCGWCNANSAQYQCIAGDSAPYVASTCSSGPTYTADIDQCPEAFPSYAIALIVIGGVVLVGIIIFAIMKVRSSKSDYQEIS